MVPIPGESELGDEFHCASGVFFCFAEYRFHLSRFVAHSV